METEASALQLTLCDLVDFISEYAAFCMDSASRTSLFQSIPKFYLPLSPGQFWDPEFRHILDQNLEDTQLCINY